jgi:hypothetical protein
VNNPVREEMASIVEYLRTDGATTAHNLLAAGLIWLFGNLVFMPLANSLNWQTRIICTLIFFVAFTIFVIRALPGAKKMIDAFSIFPAKKYGVRKGLSYQDSLIVSRHSLYMIFALVLYLLYLPFLTSFHFSIAGIVLILVLIWMVFLALRLLSILSKRILEGLY